MVTPCPCGCNQLQIHDDPQADGTDFAHPAWWRGNDQGVATMCVLVHEILDGKGKGGVANDPWESVRRRLFELEIAVGQAVEFAEYVETHAKGKMETAARQFLSLDYAQTVRKRLGG